MKIPPEAGVTFEEATSIENIPTDLPAGQSGIFWIDDFYGMVKFLAARPWEGILDATIKVQKSTPGCYNQG